MIRIAVPEHAGPSLISVFYRRGPSPDYDAAHHAFLHAWDQHTNFRDVSLTISHEDHPGQDIGALQDTCRGHAAEPWLVWLGAHARPLHDGWLDRLTAAMDDLTVGMAAVCGSHEVNPHLRTSAFAVRPALVGGLYPEPVETRRDCYIFEHGARNFTIRLRDADWRTVVVGRVGVFDFGDWERSGTYRVGEQENLLVADRATDEWANATPPLRDLLYRYCWQSAEFPTHPDESF